MNQTAEAPNQPKTTVCMQGTRNDVSDVSSEPRLGQNESDESIPPSLTALNAARAGGSQAIKHSAAGDD
jgi:hypothetical protein